MLVEIERSALLERAVAAIRDKNTKPPAFRKNMRRIGRYLFYEAAKSFELVPSSVETPIETASTFDLKQDVVIISVLRASLPMVDGVFEELDDAALGVASASRGDMIDEKGREFEIKSDYMKLPDLGGKIAVIVDPMLATASTISFLLNEVEKENPVKIVLLCAIAARYGIDKIKTNFPNVEIYSAALDKTLNEKGYIVPGLGDAGDRACNTPH